MMAREDKLVQVLRQSLKESQQGTQPHVLVALSGGVDSVALLGAVKSLVDTGKVRASVVHVDHAVRADSATESAEVIAFAKSLGFEVFSTRLAEDAVRNYAGTGPEEALRRARYMVFYQFFEETGADLVALAHHQQDQAETVLMHILRGAGMRGAGGMRQYSMLEVPWWPVRQPDGAMLIPGAYRARLPIWRPFLQTSKAELQDFVERHHFPVWEDASNQDRVFRRNAIRHDVLPLLEEIYPGSTGTLARFGRILGEDDLVLDSWARQNLESAGVGSALVVARSIFRNQNGPIQRRMLRLWILRQAGGLELSFDRVNAVAEAIQQLRGRKVIELGEGWSVIVERETVRIERGAVS
jgi:tRNA(Ile)-lysidine synthase